VIQKLLEPVVVAWARANLYAVYIPSFSPFGATSISALIVIRAFG
jgi:hypothetical protein